MLCVAPCDLTHRALSTPPMTDTNPSERSLLTGSDVQLLADPDAVTGNTDELRENLVEGLTGRVWSVMQDIKLLYMTLTDEELTTLFEGPTGSPGAVRAPAQHAITFLYYGLQLTDDDLSLRLSNAIEEAEADSGRDAQVTLDILTQSFLSPAEQVQAIKNGHCDQLSPMAIERLYFDERVPPAQVVTALASLGEKLSVDTLREEREQSTQIERMSAPVITAVEGPSDSSSRGQE